MTSADHNRQKLTQLRKLLIQHFSLDELRVLCFDLGLEYEELPGDTRTTKMHSLIEYLQRRGELSRLLNEAIHHRPNVAWPTFEDGKSTAQKDEPAGSSQSFIHEKSGLEMLLIPAGEFLYGEEKELKFLPAFWMAKTPVTNAHYAKFVQDAGYKPPSHWENDKSPASLADHPVVQVSWHDAAAFAQWAGLQLPTEQQWEKAARGQDGRGYPWGNRWKPYCNTREAGIGKTTPVGYYSPFGDSPNSCVDMSGNAWEWTDSWYDSEEKWRVLRGGSWDLSQGGAQVTFRYYEVPHDKSDSFGFRVVSLVGLGS
jgi:formylglycine-generating enzyme required for sulfatase activity